MTDYETIQLLHHAASWSWQLKRIEEPLIRDLSWIESLNFNWLLFFNVFTENWCNSFSETGVDSWMNRCSKTIHLVLCWQRIQRFQWEQLIQSTNFNTILTTNINPVKVSKTTLPRGGMYWVVRPQEISQRPRAVQRDISSVEYNPIHPTHGSLQPFPHLKSRKNV